ncbi:uncharacterized protein LOC143848111 isoform X3 [Tasmannia lanceolata]|uniref:uncharacterized protein LOC143848111 isoform X3 n=1 Tax=Tasmannia lanceolata TaxID=3420 RepID=UPI0040646F91
MYVNPSCAKEANWVADGLVNPRWGGLASQVWWMSCDAGGFERSLEKIDNPCQNKSDQSHKSLMKILVTLAKKFVKHIERKCKREGFLQSIKDEEGEACSIYGFLEVNKVAGNFHFAPRKSFQQSNIHVHDFLAFQKDSFNISHKINRLAFGEYFPGVVNPLDGVQWVQRTTSAMYQYFIKSLQVGSFSLFSPSI